MSKTVHDGACHAKIKTDGRHWRTLPLVGIQRYVGADQDVIVELRNCTCGSTLGRRVRGAR
jgi:predicted nucleic acid-binding Zn finger protein